MRSRHHGPTRVRSVAGRCALSPETTQEPFMAENPTLDPTGASAISTNDKPARRGRAWVENPEYRQGPSITDAWSARYTPLHSSQRQRHATNRYRPENLRQRRDGRLLPLRELDGMRRESRVRTVRFSTRRFGSSVIDCAHPSRNARDRQTFFTSRLQAGNAPVPAHPASRVRRTRPCTRPARARLPTWGR